jgi:hypothetical protein
MWDSLQKFGISESLAVNAETNLVSISRSLGSALNMPHRDWNNLARSWLQGKAAKEEWDFYLVNLMILRAANVEA